MSTSLSIKVVSLLVYVATSTAVVVMLADSGAPSARPMAVAVFG